MKDKVLSWMREQRMTAPGDTVICAVSGGADSVCMLHVLLSLRTALGITVEAVHFNHHLRGAESDRDESFVRALCAKLDVALHIGNGDVRARAAKRHESVEEAARALRYAFFASLPGLIATAHTEPALPGSAAFRRSVNLLFGPCLPSPAQRLKHISSKIAFLM